jgi:hypothetical protein
MRQGRALPSFVTYHHIPNAPTTLLTTRMVAALRTVLRLTQRRAHQDDNLNGRGF